MDSTPELPAREPIHWPRRGEKIACPPCKKRQRKGTCEGSHSGYEKCQWKPGVAKHNGCLIDGCACCGFLYPDF